MWSASVRRFALEEDEECVVSGCRRGTWLAVVGDRAAGPEGGTGYATPLTCFSRRGRRRGPTDGSHGRALPARGVVALAHQKKRKKRKEKEFHGAVGRRPRLRRRLFRRGSGPATSVFIRRPAAAALGPCPTGNGGGVAGGYAPIGGVGRRAWPLSGSLPCRSLERVPAERHSLRAVRRIRFVFPPCYHLLASLPRYFDLSLPPSTGAAYHAEFLGLTGCPPGANVGRG